MTPVTVAVFNAHPDTIAMLHLALQHAGVTTIDAPLREFDRGTASALAFLRRHEPDAVVYDVSPQRRLNELASAVIQPGPNSHPRQVSITDRAHGWRFLDLLATVARLAGSGGVRSVVAESVLVKQQLLILNRAWKRSPHLRYADRIGAGVCALLMRPRRPIRSAIILKRSTLLSLRRPLTKGKYRWLFSRYGGSRAPRGPTREVMAAVVDMKQQNPTWVVKNVLVERDTVPEMKQGSSKPACRSRLQIAVSCSTGNEAACRRLPELGSSGSRRARHPVHQTSADQLDVIYSPINRCNC
jgi:hypothetical protein